MPKLNDEEGDSFHLWQLRIRDVFENMGLIDVFTANLTALGENDHDNDITLCQIEFNGYRNRHTGARKSSRQRSAEV